MVVILKPQALFIQLCIKICVLRLDKDISLGPCGLKLFCRGKKLAVHLASGLRHGRDIIREPS